MHYYYVVFFAGALFLNQQCIYVLYLKLQYPQPAGIHAFF